MTVTENTPDLVDPPAGHDDTAPAGDGDDAPVVDEPVVDELVEDELLVEEISIDGMCGVY